MVNFYSIIKIHQHLFSKTIRLKKMVKIENNGYNAELKIKTIELINGSLQLPVGQNTAISSFNFNINIESRADAQNKLAFVIVHVEIKNDMQSAVLGGLSVSCIFEIVNFDDVIKTEPDGKLNIPQSLIETPIAFPSQLPAELCSQLLREPFYIMPFCRLLSRNNCKLTPKKTKGVFWRNRYYPNSFGVKS